MGTLAGSNGGDGASSSIRRLSRVVACSAAILAAPAITLATVIPVTSCDDDGSPGTLRSAVASAVNNDFVDLTQLNCSTISLDDTVGAVYVKVSFLGIGTLTDKRINIGAGFHQQVFLHAGVGRLSLFNLNMSGGMYLEPGGCIRSTGSVYLSGSTVSNCRGTDKGGGIFAQYDVKLVGSRVTDNTVDAHTVSLGGGVYAGRDLTLIQSTISGNAASSYASIHGAGGGAFARGSVVVQTSTISGNTAYAAGGLYAAGSGKSFLVTNSTVSGNTALAAAGMLFAASPLIIQNSTIAFNQTTAAHAALVCLNSAVCATSQQPGPIPAFTSSIIASNRNTAAAANADLCSVQQPSGAKNLIVSANMVPPGTLASDPQLGPLRDNGGLTLTHALSSGSPAIDAGDEDGWNVDQRGSQRISGRAADIGAYELDQGEIVFASGFD